MSVLNKSYLFGLALSTFLLTCISPLWAQVKCVECPEVNQISFEDDLFAELEQENEDTALLPSKMLITQRLIWGKNGLARITGIVPLSEENRLRELKWRRTMLKTHQVIGYTTLAAMVAQGIIGGKLYNGDYSLYKLHKDMGNAVTALYFTGAGLSLFAPPAIQLNKTKGLNSARMHKWLATVHLSAMIATQYYSDRDRDIHKAAAYTLFGSYAAATLVLRFK